MLVFAAILLVLLAMFHSIVGERLILQPIKKANSLPEIWGSRTATFRTIQATWHLVSVLWLALAGCLVVIEYSPDSLLNMFLLFYGIVFGLLAIVPFVWNSGNHKTWILFAVISALLLFSLFLRSQ